MDDLVSVLTRAVKSNGDNIDDKVYGKYYEFEGCEIYIIILLRGKNYKIYEARKSWNSKISINTVNIEKDIMTYLSRATS
jgi:hypothetical protein